MFKTMKYELIKNRVSIFVILGLMACLEVLFLYENFFDFDHVFVGISMLLMMSVVAFFWILINGITMFSRDFNNKSGYLVYMTPQPAVKIVMAKILTAFCTGVVFLTGYYLLGVLDIQMMISAGAKFFGQSDMAGISAFLGALLSRESFLSIGQALIVMVVNLFYILNIAYLSISVGNTLLRGKKFQGIVTFIIFIVISLILSWISNLILPTMDFSFELTENGMVIGNINLFTLKGGLSLLYSLGMGVLAMFGSAYLIENKIDL